MPTEPTDCFAPSLAKPSPARAFATRCLLACAATALLLGAECITLPAADPTPGEDTSPAVRTNTISIHTTLGRIVVELSPDKAPQAVANLLQYVKEGYYDNTIVHEVGPTWNYLVGGVYPHTLVDDPSRQRTLVNESDNGLTNTRGTVALFGPAQQSSGLPKLLVNLIANPDLDYKSGIGRKMDYTVVGKITQGLDIADEIGALETVHRATSEGIPLPRLPQTDTSLKVRILRIDEGVTDPPTNTPPHADAGPNQAVATKASVALDASASSDPDGDPIIGYKWELTEQTKQALTAAGLSVTLTNATSATAHFTAPAFANALELAFQLTVRDDRSGSSTATTTVSVAANSPPHANAGPPQSVLTGKAVNLAGSGSSDPDGDTLTYSWTQLSGTHVTLSGATGASPSFTAPLVSGDLVFQLSVSDGVNPPQTATVTVTVHHPPTANAGADQNVLVNNTVTLQGSGLDPEGTLLTFAWSQTAGTAVTLSAAAAQNPTFAAPTTTGRLEFTLTVTDANGGSASDTIVVNVYIQTPSGLKYCDVVVGTGTLVVPTSTVRVNYTGRLDDQQGTVFDSTDGRSPAQFGLNQVIQGWQEGLGQYNMHAGGTRLLIIPPGLGYGGQTKKGIPPYSTLWFQVDVLEVLP